MMNPASAEVLEQNIGKLGTTDQTFASSLLYQFKRTGKLSEKQWHWVDVLAKRAQEGDTTPDRGRLLHRRGRAVRPGQEAPEVPQAEPGLAPGGSRFS
jgi:hypothetical protein